MNNECCIELIKENEALSAATRKLHEKRDQLQHALASVENKLEQQKEDVSREIMVLEETFFTYVKLNRRVEICLCRCKYAS